MRRPSSIVGINSATTASDQTGWQTSSTTAASSMISDQMAFLTASWTRRGDFVLREPVGGVTQAIVSYAKERITVKANSPSNRSQVDSCISVRGNSGGSIR